jgi:2-amino-4-hydroxy-6-hydroxymethyldihydropteridine diphosphokinase
VNHDAFIGLGANLGDPQAAIGGALGALARLPSSRLIAVSSLYRSAPVDAGGPDFVNAVARIETTLEPAALLRELQDIEARFGRQRPYRNSPRTLDLDLLLYDDLRVDEPSLQVPHPRMHQRAFVLAPLAEIDPQRRIPGQPALAELLAMCSGQAIERLRPAPDPAGPPCARAAQR